MSVTKDFLIGKLPPYQDQWILVNDDQDVKDIIKEILRRHKQFAGYYDLIALYFDKNTTQQICDELYNFCLSNIRYDEEKDTRQTTAIPAGILIRGKGDCKHYASFIGGVLDGINRLTGKKIDWCYRFASYRLFDTTPHHVFIVVKDKGEELWIDPTPEADKKDPVWKIDKRIKSNSMALLANIGFIGATESTSDTGGEGSGLSVVLTIAKDIFSFISKLGDQVPNYPIRSINTYNEIVANYTKNFPVPNSLAEAQQQLQKIEIWLQAAIDAGANTPNNEVDTTYYMIATELKNKLLAYVSAASVLPPGTPLPKLPTTKTPTDTTKIAGLPLPALLIVGGLAFGLMQKKKSVHGSQVGIGQLLIFGVGGYLLLNSMKGGSSSKRQDLIDWLAASPGDTPESIAAGIATFKQMTSAEINDVWSYIFEYRLKDLSVPADLSTRIAVISQKYNIFT
jgi:hypothetical protein